MNKTNIFSLTILAILAGCSLQLQAGALSDLLGKFKPVAAKMAAWRQRFTTTAPVLNNPVIKQETIKLQPEFEPLKEGIQRIFQKEYELQKNAFECDLYYKRKYDENGQAKFFGSERFVKETQADWNCNKAPKKVIQWKYTHFLTPAEKTVVVAMCPIPDCKMFTIWELGSLAHCEKTGKVIELTKGNGKIK